MVSSRAVQPCLFQTLWIGFCSKDRLTMSIRGLHIPSLLAFTTRDSSSRATWLAKQHPESCQHQQKGEGWRYKKQNRKVVKGLQVHIRDIHSVWMNNKIACLVLFKALESWIRFPDWIQLSKERVLEYDQIYSALISYPRKWNQPAGSQPLLGSKGLGES